MMPFAAALSKALSTGPAATRLARLGGTFEERLQPALDVLIADGTLFRLERPFFGGFDVWHGVYHSRGPR